VADDDAGAASVHMGEAADAPVMDGGGMAGPHLSSGVCPTVDEETLHLRFLGRERPVASLVAHLEAGADRKALYAPYNAEAFARTTAPLWATLDLLHPELWKQGRQFPANTPVMRQMLADGELSISLTFNPNEAANQIAAKALPASVVSYQHSAGTIGNTHFLAIPFNARAKAAAQVTANFLLSPLAQARKADIRHWGDPTVLALDKLSAAERALFTGTAAPGQVGNAAPTLPEPHGSWVDPIEREWTRRYGQG